jgi:EmrB/QacA subfamily drug resistance transporter
MWAGVSALALAVGPVLGGFLTEHVSWRAIFYLNIPVAIGAVTAALFAVRESRDTSVGREVDYAGVATLTTGLTALILALVEGNSWGWDSPEIVGLLAAAVLGLGAFVAIEQRVKVPMVDFSLLSDRNFLGAVVVALIVSFSMLGVFFFLALYMQDILRYSPLEAGVRFLPSTLMIVGVAPVAGRLSDRFGPRWLIAGGLAIVAASLYSFSGIAVDSGYLDLLPGFMLLGIGIAMTMSPMTSAAMNAVPVQKAGIASGVLSMFRMVGGSLGVAVTGAIFQARVGASFETASPQQFVDALGVAMMVCAGVALLGAAIGAVAIRAKKNNGEHLLTVEAAEANVNPGGSAVAAREAELETV